MKIKVSTDWLSGCSGCHVALVDLHEKLLNLVEEIEFVRIPVLMDEKGYPPAEIGIVEGAIRSHHDRECLKKMRDSVKKLVAYGSCAVFGGPSGIGWLYGRDTILNKAYGEGPTNVAGARPDSNAPVLEESVIPIDEVVEVDFYLPGCPPHPLFTASAIRALCGNSGAQLSEKTVCSDCTRKMRKCAGVNLKKGAVTADDKDLCFLSQGVVCMGSVTLNRCLAQCPAAGVACAGCAGPSIDIITEPQLDIRNLLARRMNMVCGIEINEVLGYLEKEAKTYYAYAMASPVIYKKPTVEIREWAGESGN